MATKKQKRAVAEAKHAKMMDELRRTGLEAQRKDQEYRKKKHLEAWEEKHAKHTWKKRDSDCPWCKDELKLAKARNKQFDAMNKAV